jgi:hypothetical protein
MFYCNKNVKNNKNIATIKKKQESQNDKEKLYL